MELVKNKKGTIDALEQASLGTFGALGSRWAKQLRPDPAVSCSG